jgi:hypothetical protein
MNPGAILMATMAIEILLLFAYGLNNQTSDPTEDYSLYM